VKEVSHHALGDAAREVALSDLHPDRSQEALELEAIATLVGGGRTRPERLARAHRQEAEGHEEGEERKANSAHARNLTDLAAVRGAAPGKPRTKPLGAAVQTLTVGDAGATFELPVDPGDSRSRRYFLAATINGEWSTLSVTARR